MYLDLLGRADSGNGLLVVVVCQVDQGCKAVCLLAPGDCMVGSLLMKPDLVCSFPYDKQKIGDVEETRCVLGSDCCYLPGLAEV